MYVYAWYTYTYKLICKYVCKIVWQNNTLRIVLLTLLQTGRADWNDIETATGSVSNKKM